MLKRISICIVLAMFMVGASSCCKGHCWFHPTRADNCCAEHKGKCCGQHERVYDGNSVR